MRFSVRKTIRLGGGVRLNLSRSGIGTSVGGKYVRVGTGPRGTRLYGRVPGTPIRYSSSLGAAGRRTSTRAARIRPQAPAVGGARSAPAARPGTRRSGRAAFVFWLVLGLVGGHRYYLGRVPTAMLQTLTLGGLGVWWLIDLLLLPGMVRSANGDR